MACCKLEKSVFPFSPFFLPPPPVPSVENTTGKYRKRTWGKSNNLAVNKVTNSLKYQNGRYQLAIPWKEDPSNLPSNYDMALKRLKNTEKRLVNDPELSGAYSNIIEQYLKKKYIRKVPKEEVSSVGVWYLAHIISQYCVLTSLLAKQE